LAGIYRAAGKLICPRAPSCAVSMKVAVVGVGRWGFNHVRVLSEIRKMHNEVGLEDLVVVDTDKARAKYVAGVFGAKWAADVGELLSEHVDAAIVAVPTVHHYSVAAKLLPHMDVMVEKPIAANLEEAKAMGELAEREGRLLAVGHIERFNPVVPALKERLRSDPERIVGISAQRIGPGPPSNYTLNLGVAHDLLVHDVDVACYLLESLPNQVIAKAHWNEHGLETDIVAIYSFDEKDALGEFRASWRASPNLKRRSLTVQLESKIVEIDYILQVITFEKGLLEHKSKGEYSEIISTYTSRSRESWSLLGVRKEPLLLEDLHFLRCVQRKERPINSWEEGFKALKCVVRAIESAKTGRAVSIDWE